MTRIHILLEEAEKERYRAQAAREGKSLAAWLREAAREKLAAAERSHALDTVDELRAFFIACSERETEPEPDWDAQRRVIEDSVRSGSANS